MSRECVDPQERPNGRDGTILAHPAFGQITISRISGNRALYGSDFMHHNYVRISIHHSELHRDLSRDWHYPRQYIAIVDLSEAQWATFVSAFGIGEGVPCTLVVADGQSIPEFPLRDSGQHYKAEADAKLQEAIDSLDALEKRLADDTAGLSKVKSAKLLAYVHRARMELASNLPFVAKSVGEHMETRVEKAKVEVAAYIAGAIMRAGLEGLGGAGPFAIEAPRPDKADADPSA